MLSDDDDDDNDDVLNSSMNSSTSKHRKVSPNKISPRVSLDNMPEEGRYSKLVYISCKNYLKVSSINEIILV